MLGLVFLRDSDSDSRDGLNVDKKSAADRIMLCYGPANGNRNNDTEHPRSYFYTNVDMHACKQQNSDTGIDIYVEEEKKGR